MIVCCGENLIDMVPLAPSAERPYGGFKLAPGGCPYTSAIAAARLGAGVEFLGAMAGDFLGDRLFSRLVESGVGTRFLRRVDKPVTLAFVERSASGEARYAFYAQGAADRSLQPEDLPASLPEEARFLLLGSISLILEPGAGSILALAEREAPRRILSFDPNIRSSLIPDRAAYLRRFERICALSAIVKASDSDIEWLYGFSDPETAISHILSLGPELVVLTMGEKGSMAATKRSRARAAAVEADVVDTIGAGDCFHAAVLAALDGRGCADRSMVGGLGEAELADLLEFASAAAAMDCAREGAEPPWLSELEERHPAAAAALERLRRKTC